MRGGEKDKAGVMWDMEMALGKHNGAGTRRVRMSSEAGGEKQQVASSTSFTRRAHKHPAEEARV